jgi:hypothetical protein
VDAFCEACGRHPNLLQRARGRGIAPCRDACGLYVCPDCEHPDPLEAFPQGPARIWRPTGSIAVAALAVFAFIAVSGVMIATNGTPRPTGGVLAARQEGPGARATPRVVPASQAQIVPATPVPATPAAASPTGAPTPPPAATPSVSPSPEGGIAVGQASLRTWRGAVGELRLQVIVPVRNAGSDWMRLTRSASTYEVYDRAHRSMAGGIFTIALPEVVGPGETAYLVDTLSLAFGKPSDFASSKAVVTAAPAAPPSVRLSVTSIALSIGTDRGLRAVGEVRNEGGVTARSIVAGVVVLDGGGRPLAAVYDLTDTGELEPGARISFDTGYPGAPPVGAEAATRLAGYGFTTGD